MPGLRNAAATAVGADVAQLLTDLQTYFALQQPRPDLDVRALFVQWFFGQLINLDAATAQAARTTNLEDSTAWGRTLVQLDPFAGA